MAHPEQPITFQRVNLPALGCVRERFRPTIAERAAQRTQDFSTAVTAARRAPPVVATRVAPRWSVCSVRRAVAVGRKTPGGHQTP